MLATSDKHSASCQRWHDLYQRVLTENRDTDNCTKAFETLVGKPPTPSDGESYKTYRQLVTDLHRFSDNHEKYPAAVTVFGSARIAQDSPYYEIARELGKALAKHQCRVRTGAGPGIMEAVPKGFKEDSKLSESDSPSSAPTQGVRIELPFEQETSPSIDVNTRMRTFAIRRAALIYNSSGIAVMPGGLGTVNEIFEAWIVAKDGLITCPIVFLPSSFYEPFLQGLETAGAAKQNTVTIDDLKFLQKANTVAEAVPMLQETLNPAWIDKSLPKRNLRERILRLRQELGRGLTKASELPSPIVLLGAPGLSEMSHEVAFARKLAKWAILSEELAIRLASFGEYQKAVESSLKGDSQPTSNALLQIFVRDNPDHCPDSVELEHSHDYTLLRFSTRVAHRQVLTHNARALVFLPSDLNGLDVLFACVCEMQCNLRPRRPILLVGREFWHPIVDGVRRALTSDSKEEFISDGDIELMTVIDASDAGMKEAKRYIRLTMKEGSLV